MQVAISFLTQHVIAPIHLLDHVHLVVPIVEFLRAVRSTSSGPQQNVLTNTTNTIMLTPTLAGIESTSFGNTNRSLYTLILSRFNLPIGRPISTFSFFRISTFLHFLCLFPMECVLLLNGSIPHSDIKSLKISSTIKCLHILLCICTYVL